MLESSQENESRAQSTDSSKAFTVNRELSIVELSWVYFAKVKNFKDEKETTTIAKKSVSPKKPQGCRVVAPWLVD